MPPLPDNPLAAVVVALLFLLIGGGSGGAIVAIRKDARSGDREDVDLTRLVKEVAADTISDLRAEVQAGRRESTETITTLRAEVSGYRAEVHVMRSTTARYEGRVIQLEGVIRGMGGTVPPWPNT